MKDTRNKVVGLEHEEPEMIEAALEEVEAQAKQD